ncbi:MAG: class I SAM-dependent methyltransferase [Paracoccaceae bacterium]
MEFDETMFDRAKAAFLGPESDRLIACLAGLNLGRPVEDDHSLALAAELGWTLPGDRSLTALGGLVSDSCREYLFWIERGRRLPFLGFTDALTETAFHGKAVLEIGAGMGANLMSLSHLASKVEGLEPVAIYRQMGAILRQREGLPAARQGPSLAEALPHADASFDVALCVSAHQYMDLAPAFAEAARVLRPGGELILIGGVLDKYLRELLRDLPRRPALIRPGLVTLINTLGYMALGRRVIPARGGAMTSRPIYPPASSVCRLLADAGLSVTVPGTVLSDERVFRATKPLN